jgi:predicted DNA-binding transcriptional regulator AlpA
MAPSVPAASVADPPRDAVSAVPSPLLLRAADAAALCKVSLRTWRGWDVAGRVPQPVRIGRAVFWRLDELRAWVAAGCPDRGIWQSLQ